MAKKIYGIIGHPVRHSLSPAMQNAAFRKAGIGAEYKLFDVEPVRLEDFLAGLAENKISGVNVTIPHKVKAEEFIARCGVLDENAKRLGAVNTIKVMGGSLHGYNTDGAGFYRSLVEDLGFEPEGKRICVLGAGGAAKAVIMYLGNGPERIFVSDIDDAKTDELKEHYKRYYDEKRLKIVKRKDLKAAIGDSSLLVNATPIGMEEDVSPVDKEFLRSGLYVYDLVYNRPFTRLVRDSKDAKAYAVTGIGMLLHQGAIAFEIWTGKKAPIGVMRKELKKGLRGLEK